MNPPARLVFPIYIPEIFQIRHNRTITIATEKMASRYQLIKLIEGTRFSPTIRNRKWSSISETALSSSPTITKPNFCKINSADLANLYQMIDKAFFKSMVDAHVKSESAKLSFRVSKRMTSSGGITTTRTGSNGKQEFEIAVSSTLLFESFRDEKPINVTGLMCDNRLQALLRVMEHEMIHLIEMLLWKDSSCAQIRFKDIARRFFGHRQSTHQLLAPADTALSNFGINVGDQVRFRRNDIMLTGFVNRITRRATVLVASQKGTCYSDGQRYLKFYVPLKNLLRVG